MNAVRQTYTVRPDGTIEFDPEQYDDEKRMFAKAGIDITEIRTEADYRNAFSAAGDYFFERLLAESKAGNKACRIPLQAFLKARFKDFKTLIRRQTFEVIPGGRSSPPRSS
jgi:hypothetical protein